MTITYYGFSATHSSTTGGTYDTPSGTYTQGGYSVTVGSIQTIRVDVNNEPATYCVFNLTGDTAEWISNRVFWYNGNNYMRRPRNHRTILFEVKDSGGTGVEDVINGAYWSSGGAVDDGFYFARPPGDETFTPTKDSYTFDPSSFSYVTSSGYGAYVTITAAPSLTLENPTEDGTNYYLNKDLLLEMRWADTDPYAYSEYTVHFEGVARTDRTRYSIVAFKMFLDVVLDYDTTYSWFVRKDLGGGNSIDSDTWSFTTMTYAPPAHSTRTRPPYGGGADITVPTGENNIITVQRLIAVANDKFWYEDV